MNKPIASITLTSEWTKAKVITGGTVNLSIEDARALYNLTTTPAIVESGDTSLDEDKYNNQNVQCRLIIRNIAKAILLTTGEATDLTNLVDSLKGDSIQRDEEHQDFNKKRFVEE